MTRYTHPDLKDVPLTAVMQALSDPFRLAIVQALVASGKRELSGKEIPLKLAKATRSHHFGILRRAELNRRFPGLMKLLLANRGRPGRAKK
jgi:DNA-binding transcriptional ArsR family regulator